MIRIALIATAALIAAASASPVMAQAGSPVRTLSTSDVASGGPLLIAERKSESCTDKSCKPAKRSGYAPAAPLGW